MTTAIVMLSGGMDSAVALYWALSDYKPVHAITFDYGQIASQEEQFCAAGVWHNASEPFGHRLGNHWSISIPRKMLATKSSLLGDSEVNEYANVNEAIDNTPNDRSYIPLRNSILVTLAAHHLLAIDPAGGVVVTGIRGRADPNAAPGFPDCTHAFATKMTEALTEAAGVSVVVLDPLNLYAPSREKTIELALTLPGCYEALASTTSCFRGINCGKCLPCLRRAQAFAAVGRADPAIESEEVV